jgi:Protein of unknown function (DUF3800)
MYTAYFDESGVHQGSPAAVVAGYLSTDERWSGFEREWRNLLVDHGVSAFHRTHLESFRGEFCREAGWDENRRRQLLRSAHDIIKRYTLFGVGAAVVRLDFEKEMPAAVRTAFGGPYGWLVHDCLVGVGHWAVDNRCTEGVGYVFEAGARGRHQVEKMFAVLCRETRFRDLCRIGSWKFSTKAEALQLQAADILAYEIYKHMDNRIVARSAKRPIRRSAFDLFRLQTDKAHYWDAARFRKWLERTAPLVAQVEERERRLLAAGRKDLV